MKAVLQRVSRASVSVDGEIKGALNIDFKIIRNGFNFVIPKGSDFKFKKQ